MIHSHPNKWYCIKAILCIQVNKELNPAEKALDNTAAVIGPMKPQLDKLKDLLQDGRQKAQGAKDSADNAAEEADLANKVRDQQQPFTNFCLKIVFKLYLIKFNYFFNLTAQLMMKTLKKKQLQSIVTWCNIGFALFFKHCIQIILLSYSDSHTTPLYVL